MLLAKCCSLCFFIMCFQLATIMYECITLVVRYLFLLCFQLAPTMYECYCSRGLYYIFIMCFQLATTTYEHYYQREPVNFFIMFIYLTTTTYACYWPSAAVYIFSLCVPASRNHVWMHYSGGSVSFFYCASSWPRPCMNVTVQEVHTIFLLCVSS